MTTSPGESTPVPGGLDDNWSVPLWGVEHLMNLEGYTPLPPLPPPSDGGGSNVVRLPKRKPKVEAVANTEVYQYRRVA